MHEFSRLSFKLFRSFARARSYFFRFCYLLILLLLLISRCLLLLSTSESFSFDRGFTNTTNNTTHDEFNEFAYAEASSWCAAVSRIHLSKCIFRYSFRRDDSQPDLEPLYWLRVKCIKFERTNERKIKWNILKINTAKFEWNITRQCSVCLGMELRHICCCCCWFFFYLDFSFRLCLWFLLLFLHALIDAATDWMSKGCFWSLT